MNPTIKRFLKHLLVWLIIWFVESLLFSWGRDLHFYLVKNVAIVSLQAIVVYINWSVLARIKWNKLIHLVNYAVFIVILVYLIFAISFQTIDYSFSLFFPEIRKIGVSESWWPTGFWRILSGSAPYSIALLVSTIFHLVVGKRNTSEVETDIAENPRSNGILTLKDGKTIHRIKKTDVLFIEGLKEYVNWHTDEQQIITLHSLRKIEDLLKEEGFLRIHKSFIVNTSHINTIKYNWIEVPGKRLPIGRSYRAIVSKYFQTDI